MTPNALSRATSKIERRLIPFLMLLFLLAFLDRANVGFVKADLEISVGISDAVFAFGAGLFFLTYALFEVPSNVLMHRFGAKIWLSRIMVTWGLASAAMMFTKGPMSFYALRMLLGAAEAGLFPAAIYYMSVWFPDGSRGKAMGYFFVAAPLALVVGGPLSGLLLQLDGVAGLTGWQWVFLIEGLVTCVIGFWAFFYLEDSPQGATWLSDDERQALTRQLAREASTKVTDNTAASWPKLLSDPRIWGATIVHFFGQIAFYGVVFYLPVQVSTLLGMKMGLTVGLATAVPWAMACVVCVLLPSLADRTHTHRMMCVGLFVVGGLSLALTSVNSIWISMTFICTSCASLLTVCSLYWTFLPRCLSGGAAARGIGFASSLGIVGAFIAPNLRSFVTAQMGAPVYGLYAVAFAALFGAVFVSMLRWPINGHQAEQSVDLSGAPALLRVPAHD